STEHRAHAERNRPRAETRRRRDYHHAQPAQRHLANPLPADRLLQGTARSPAPSISGRRRPQLARDGPERFPLDGAWLRVVYGCARAQPPQAPRANLHSASLPCDSATFVAALWPRRPRPCTAAAQPRPVPLHDQPEPVDGREYRDAFRKGAAPRRHFANCLKLSIIIATHDRPDSLIRLIRS